MISRTLRTARLLTMRHRILLGLLVLMQILLAFLDLAAIALIGVLFSLSAPKNPLEALPIIGSWSAALRQSFAENPSEVFSILVTVVLVSLFSKTAMSFLFLRYSFIFLARRQAELSAKMHSKFISQELGEIEKSPSQNTVHALTNGVSAAITGLLGNSVIILAESAVVTVLSAALLVVNAPMAIFSLCLFGLAAAILNQVLGRWAGQLGERATKTDIESLRLVQESIRSYRELSASGRKGFFADKFYDVRMQGAKTNAELQILSQVSKFVFEGTLIAGVAGIALAYSFFTTATEALVTIAIFFAVGARISPSILRIQSASVSMRTSASVAMPSLELVGALFPRGVQLPDVSRRSIRNEDHHLDRLPYPPRIELSNVSFYHSNSSELAVDSVSFTIASGESLALVGPSGSGKTTLVDLLLGVRRPNSGSLTIDSMAPKDYCQVRPGAVAYVPQTTFLTEGTIGQNVSLGIPESLVDANRVAVSLEEAKFLTGSKPSKKNPDSLVGEHGLRLSGGQRQRLGIARALYSRPRLIVLDEATSALDSTTELAVADHFAAFSGEVTLVVVSHRLSTIRHCDRIAFMSSGKIVAIGSFSDLMKKVPEFKTQVESSGFL